MKKPPLLVPVGHVMNELHTQMKAGRVSGYTSIDQFYKDGIHLNEAGSYLVGCTYGAHDKYEDILRRTRERTTAEILMQNDHVTKTTDLTEETDAAKLPQAGKHWDAFMNHNHLPSLAKKYGAELCDQRALWKVYLTESKLEPKALLRDSVHLNAHGEWLMAECVKAYLRHDPKLGPSPAEDWVKTYEVGKDVRWADSKLRLEFEGSRIEVICRPGEAERGVHAASTSVGEANAVRGEVARRAALRG